MPEPDQPELQGLDPGELLARGMHTVRPSGSLHNWTPPTPEELARLLPQYHIEIMIGHGGMGAVYKGFQEKLGRPVAIKVLPAELTVDEQFVTRFEREARTLAKLQHPGIVAIYDFGQTADGHLYFVMEYVEGTDLRRVLQGPGLNPEQALEVIAQVCEALHAAHRQGVIHRDIKPANILLTTDGRVKLADFGLARPDRDENEGITLSNVILGTPDYMAPEQRAGQPDHRADIFALGLMLYEMLTGQLPRGAWVPPSRKVQVDVRIDEVVIKALQEEPGLRYQQASEMKTDVDHIRSGVVKTPPASPPAGTLPQVPPMPAETRRAVPWAMIVALAALAGVAAFWLFEKRGSTVPQQPVPPAAQATPDSPPPAAPQPAPPILQETVAKAHIPASAPSPAAGPAEAPPVAEAQPAPPVSSLEEAMFDYRWDYRTTKPDYSFNHSLFFRQDGFAYSIGRKMQWRFSWKKTGPRSLHIDYNFDNGLSMDIVFDETFSKFKGTVADGATLSGRRSRLATAEDQTMLAGVVKGFEDGDAKKSGGEAGDNAQPAAPVDPSAAAALQAEITGYIWAWNDMTLGNSSPNLWNEVRFEPDGTFSAWHDTRYIVASTWKITGPHEVAVAAKGRNPALTITFTDDLKRFNATNGQGGMIGSRKSPLQDAKQNAAAAASPAPTAEAKPFFGYLWKFIAPSGTFNFSFAPDGTMRDEQGRPSGWKWESRDANSAMLARSDAGNQAGIVVFNSTFTRFTGNFLGGRGGITGIRLEEAVPQPISSAPERAEGDPRDLREALLNYAWSWYSPAKSRQIRFLGNGTAALSDGGRGTWSITGARNVRFDFSTGPGNCTLAFDETFAKFEGWNHTKRWKLWGNRLERTATQTSGR